MLTILKEVKTCGCECHNGALVIHMSGPCCEDCLDG